MRFLENKPASQIELEKKIKALRDVGMNASANRLEKQLLTFTRSTPEIVKPMKGHEVARHIKAQKAGKS